MGGSQSCFGYKSHDNNDEAEQRHTSNKIFPSDEDRGRWIGEPDVDRKASAYIAKFYEERSMDLQTV